jgi:hypothetical protein
MFGIGAYSAAPYSSIAGSIKFGIAPITGSATVTVSTSGQFVYGIGAISGTCTLTGVGGFTAVGEAGINGIATVTGSSVVIWSGDASISTTATIGADGHIQGNNWTVVTATSNIWKRIG